MKYVSPEYRNEKLEANDVITASFTASKGETENSVVITGYLSQLLSNA